MESTDTTHLIRTPRAARALASPVRQEIVDALEHVGASTVAELAAHLERAADGLYFHVRALERVGVVERVGERGEGRARAAVFDVPGRPMRLDYAGAPAKRVARLGPALDCLLRLARRDVRRALAHPRTGLDGECRELAVIRVRGRVSRDELCRINALLEEVTEVVRGSCGGADGVPIALAVALAPIRRDDKEPSGGATRSKA